MKKILIVDLDGTLIYSNILYRTFWSAFAADWGIPLKSLIWLLKGKANLKNKLRQSSSVNIKNLDYNKNVINYIKQYRKKNGYIGLVTAGNHIIAKRIAKYLNLFDEVKGSTKKINLKGVAKAKFLNTRFGFKNYDYIGDSLNDIPVWESANRAISVNDNPSIIKACKRVNSNFQIIKS